MQPDTTTLMLPWYIWWIMIVSLFLMTFIGTWLITRRWSE